MTVITPLSQGQSGPDFDTLLRIWLMPAQLGLEMMESSIAFLAGTFPTPRIAVKSEAVSQDIARAAEEQVAHIDDGKDMVVLPAAVIA